jgi:hypothetical protein
MTKGILPGTESIAITAILETAAPAIARGLQGLLASPSRISCQTF